MRKLAVGDIMTRKFISVAPETNLLECSKVLTKQHEVNSLIVIKNKRLVGILTAKDILLAITKRPDINLRNQKAIDVAAKKLAVIKPSADIYQALQKMKSLNFRRLPVMSGTEVIGVITLKDILRIAPELYSDLGELASIREEERKLNALKIPWPSEGLCENCGAFSELTKVGKSLLCEDCKNDLDQ